MKSQTIRTRFWLEACLAGLFGFLSLLTVFWRDWIEATTGFDPDQHGGSVEWMIVAGLLILCLAVSAVARVEWHRPSRLARSAA
ncbi:hypothetical protein [Terrabacter sp. 2YAF2]|uniref:hypothetical protein n=1 Tax=Terrabacter sp. 2YAF2 TaxID=3233026 RepID=UPI003F95D76F